MNEHTKINFETLQHATLAGHLVLMQCKRKDTGAMVAVVCATNTITTSPLVYGGRPTREHQLIPLAELYECDPYEFLIPPNNDGGYANGNEG